MSNSRKKMSAGFLGYPGSGKTSLFEHLKSKLPENNKTATQQVGIKNCFNFINEDAIVTIWDLNQDILPNSMEIAQPLRDTNFIFIVYDPTNASSLINIGFLYRMTRLLADCDCQLVFLQNKADLKEKFVLSKASIENLNNTYRPDHHVSVSINDNKLFDDFISFFKKSIETQQTLPTSTVKNPNL